MMRLAPDGAVISEPSIRTASSAIPAEELGRIGDLAARVPQRLAVLQRPSAWPAPRHRSIISSKARRRHSPRCRGGGRGPAGQRGVRGGHRVQGVLAGWPRPPRRSLPRSPGRSPGWPRRSRPPTARRSAASSAGRCRCWPAGSSRCLPGRSPSSAVPAASPAPLSLAALPPGAALPAPAVLAAGPAAAAVAGAVLASVSSASRRAPVSRRKVRCARARSSTATSSWAAVISAALAVGLASQRRDRDAQRAGQRHALGVPFLERRRDLIGLAAHRPRSRAHRPPSRQR